MNTFEDVVNMFLSSISEVQFLNFNEEELFDELGIKVKMVIAKARVFENLSYNQNKGDFNRKITDVEATILAHGLIIEWLSPRIYNFELLESQMSSKDFSMFSNANRLSEMRALRLDSQIEFNQLIRDFDFDMMKLMTNEVK